MDGTRTIGIALGLLLTCASTAMAQTTWYIDVQATPPGVGTQAQPYASIQYAVDQPTTATGDTLLVAPGIYAERVHSPSKFLILRSQQGPHVTMIRPTVAGSIVNMPNQYASTTWPEVDGFRLQGTPGLAAYGISSADIIVKNCILDAGYASSSGIGVNAQVTVRVERCTIVNFGRAVTLNDFFGEPGGSLLSSSILDTTVQGTALLLEYCQYQTPISPALLLAGNVLAPSGIWSHTSGDVHLKPLSACIDAANPALALDPDGTRADIGVLPYDPAYAATPTTYCTPKLNSAGCPPSIRFTGSPSFSGPDDFHVIADGARNSKPGLVLWSLAPSALAFQGGTLCLASPIVRGPPHSTGGSPSGVDCTGTFDMHFGLAYATSHGLLPGVNVYVQAWGRDPGFAPPNNSQLSDAGVFEFAP